MRLDADVDLEQKREDSGAQYTSLHHLIVIGLPLICLHLEAITTLALLKIQANRLRVSISLST